jgi:hypothetical protein
VAFDGALVGGAISLIWFTVTKAILPPLQTLR